MFENVKEESNKIMQYKFYESNYISHNMMDSIRNKLNDFIKKCHVFVLFVHFNLFCVLGGGSSFC